MKIIMTKNCSTSYKLNAIPHVRLSEDEEKGKPSEKLTEVKPSGPKQVPS